MKKKKKKKAVAFNEDPLSGELEEPVKEVSASGAAEPGPSILKKVDSEGTNGTADKGEEDLDALFSGLKKKKKKKDIPLDFGEEGTAAPPADGEDSLGDLSGIKKKKKSKKTTMEDLEAFERELRETQAPEAKEDKDEDEEEAEGDEDLHIEEGDLDEDPFAVSHTAGHVDDGTVEPWDGSDRDYTYEELLARIFRTLHSQNPDLSSASRKRYTIVPPSVFREGNKKTIFANIGDICKRMHRQPEHVIQFLFAELGTTGSVDGEKRLVIKGRFQQKQLENVLRRYIVEYVTCKTCKSPDTILTKENRIYFVSCESCGSRRSVGHIQTGYHAQVGKRKKAVT